MRTCYQIHTHNHPAQVHRLVDTIRATSRDALIVVSQDRAGPELDRARLARADVQLVLSAGGYGDWSHHRRYLEVLDLLERQHADYDWMVNITGQDYPVQPLWQIEDDMASATADGFLEAFDVLSEESPWGPARAQTRYWCHYRRLTPLGDAAQYRLRPLQAINRLPPWVRVQVAYGLAVGRRVPTPFHDGLRCYGGSFFASLNRTAVDYLRRFVRDRPDVVAHFQKTLSPEEAFFQTAFATNPALSFDPDCRRYFDFSTTQLNHPRTLELSDVAKARGTGAHFARKWDLARNPDAYEAMDALVLLPMPSEIITTASSKRPDSTGRRNTS